MRSRSGPRTFDRSLKYPITKDGEGRSLCRWDQKPVARGRKAYCSDECQIEVDIRTSASALRRHVFQRDKGVCAACGCDTRRLERVASKAMDSYRDLTKWLPAFIPKPGSASYFGWSGKPVWDVWVSVGFNVRYEGTLWEADHIKELSNGGDGGLDNVQTLCVPCHKAKTRKMHADRKIARTGIKPKPPVRETQIAMINV